MCNSFIAGDLVIDHSISVRETTPGHQQIEQERICDVVRRADTAGGAANCARTLAVLSTGKTYLWGIVGNSPWGSFHDILRSSQDKDGSATNIEFRGVRDETDAQMTTVSRLIIKFDQEGNSILKFGDRFDEVGGVHVPPGIEIKSYLDLAQEELRGELEVIVLCDLDYSCLTRTIIEEVATFTKKHKVLVFVDPKYEMDKYRGLKGTAILPNLVEWCSLVGQKDKEKFWRDRIRAGADLSAMAYLSLYRLGSFDYHIIKCDRDGAILIAPDTRGRGIVYKVPFYQIRNAQPHQLGRGDVMTAAFALQFHRLLKEKQIPNGATLALLALLRSNVVVGCYRTMDWHRMPSRKMVEDELRNAEDDKISRPLESSFARPAGNPRWGISYLPSAEPIALSNHTVAIAGCYSFTTEFADQLKAIAADCAEGDRHMVLGALPGSGKSELLAALERDGSLSVKKADDIEDHTTARDETSRYLTKFFATEGRARILAIDEALTRGFEDKDRAKLWLDAADAHGVRLLLVDQGFVTTSYLNEDINFEVKRRVSMPHLLWRLDQRPRDIPLFVAATIFGISPDIREVRIRGDFLLACIDAILDNPNVGQWKGQIRQAAIPTWKEGVQFLRITGENLSSQMKQFVDDQAAALVRSTWFEFAR